MKHVLAGLLASSIMAGCGDDHPPLAPPHAPPRTVAVSGTGEVHAQPDKAIIAMGAQAIEPELEPAREKVTRAVQAFLKLTNELGIAEKHIQTSQLTVRPEYAWNPKTQQQRQVGYFVERQLRVDLRDLDMLGVLMERAVSSGVNIVSGPEFGTSREAALRRQALRRAALDARASAVALSDALGVGLGSVRRISAGQQSYVPPPMPYAMIKQESADTASVAETYQAGEINISAQVTAEFDLLPE